MMISMIIRIKIVKITLIVMVLIIITKNNTYICNDDNNNNNVDVKHIRFYNYNI